jgi:AcrR family transcriptional regulator
MDANCASVPQVESLRELKKRRTRAHISQVAMELFAERGVQAVTVSEICARAEVAPRTFFRYFPSKEDVVFPNERARRAVARDAIADERPGESLGGAARRAIQSLLEYDLQEDRDTARRRAQLLATEPALARHRAALTNEWTDELTDVVARRLGDTKQARIDARLAVGALIGTLNAAGDLWFGSQLRGDPHRLMNRAMDLVEHGLAATIQPLIRRAGRAGRPARLGNDGLS